MIQMLLRWLAGPAVLFTSAAALESLALAGLPITEPAAPLAVAVLLATWISGLAAGLVSAALAWSYIALPAWSSAMSTASTGDPHHLTVWAAVYATIAALVWAQRHGKLPAFTAPDADERNDPLRGSSLLAAVVEGTTDAVFVKDLNGRYLMANHAAARVVGRAPDEIVGLTDRDIFPDADSAATIEAVDRQVLSGERTITAEEAIVIDGERRVFLATKGIYRDPTGNVVGLFGISRDITELRRAETAVREREARLSAILDNAPQAITVVDPDGHLLQINPAGIAMLEAASEEAVLGEPIERFVAPENLPAFRAQAQSVALGRTAGLVFEVIGARGGRRWLSNQSVPLRDEEGRVRAVLGISEDISERRRAELALRQSDAHFRALLDSARDFMLYRARLNPDNAYQAQVVLVSPSISEVMGVRDPYDMSTWFDNVHPEDLPRAIEAQRRSTEEGRPFDQVLRMFHPKRQEWRWVHAISRPVYNPLDHQTYFDGYAVDVTERVQREQDMRRLNDMLELRVSRRTAELETAIRELEAFSYSVSHDLRTPLRTIAGFGEVLAEEFGSRLDDEGRRYLARIRNAAADMEQTIDGLLRLARVSRVELRRERIDLSAQALAIMEELRRQQPDRRVELHVEPDMTVEGDPALMQVVMQNLLQNAWKFTAGQPLARIEVAREAGDGSSAICVRDNGAGFDMAYADKLFGAFQRLHQAGEFPGQGIGLATVDRIVRRRGGRIWARARVGEGACFCFELPAGGAVARPEPPAEIPAQGPARG